jgi:hypothetical protein
LVRAAALAAVLALAAGAAEARCRLALALGLDVSASVDAAEYGMQVAGLAAALDSPAVREALLAVPGLPVWIAAYEWAGAGEQRMLVGWTELTGPAALDRVIAGLLTTERAEMEDSTALGEALLFGGTLLARGPGCFRKVLDVSGDGKNNDGPDPDMLDGDPLLAGVTVNALVIGADTADHTDARQVQIGDLSAYFAAHVIRGPGAFVEVALGFPDYQRAMTRKLLREVGAMAVGALAD